MKKIFRVLVYVGLTALLASCGEAAPEARTASPDDNTVQAYFYTGDGGNVETIEYLDPTTRSFPVLIARVVEYDADNNIVPASAPAVTINLTISDETGLFTIPATVDIAAGQETATFNVTISDEVETGVNYAIAINIDPTQRNLYGAAIGAYQLTKKFMLVNWIDLGEVTLTDGFLAMLGINEYPVHVFWGETTVMYKIPDYYTALGNGLDAVDYTFNIVDNKLVADGTSMTLSGTAVRMFDTGLPLSEIGVTAGAGNVLFFTDISADYTYFNPTTRAIQIESYVGFINANGGISGWGWKDINFTLPALP